MNCIVFKPNKINTLVVKNSVLNNEYQFNSLINLLRGQQRENWCKYELYQFCGVYRTYQD